MLEITSAFSDVLEQLVTDRKWRLPIHIAVVSANGVATGGSYSQAETGLDFESTYMTGDKFALPINVMFVSSDGEAAKLTISQPDGALSLIN